MLSEFWSDLRYRLRAIFRRSAVEQELDDELRFHVEHEAEKYTRAGVSRTEALRRARIALGGVDRTKEESRDARGTMLLESILQDTRYALRGLRAKPGFTASIVLTLALGIGANAAMFGIVDRMLFRSPAYLRDAEHVHRVYMSRVADREERTSAYTSFPRYLDFVRWTHAFSSFATFATWRIAVGDGDGARLTPVAGVSASYFDFFDAQPSLGRFFSAREDSVPTGSPVVVLSYAQWQLAFGGRADVVGTQIRVGHTMCTIIGVAPQHFVGVEDGMVPAMYIPITTFLWDARPTDYSKNYNWQGRALIARQKPEFSVVAANADLTAAFQRSWIAANAADPRNARPIEVARPRAILGPVQIKRGPLAGPEAKVVVWVSGVAAIVLLIACANVANLLLARAVTRRREIALRLALGVSRGRLVRQLLTESLALALLGGIAGLAVAQWGGAIIRALFLPTDVATTIFTDRRTVAVTLLATLAAAIVTGLAPALQAIRHDLARSLGAGGRDTGARSSRLRTSLVVLQATLSVVLLVGAGLFVRSLLNVRGLHLGYDVRPVLVVTDNPRGVKLTTAERIALESRLVDAARAMPGVVAATPVSSVPFWGYEEPYLFVSGDTVNRLGDFVLQAGTPDYFRTMGTRIVRGRSFDDRDRAGAARVVVVSQSMAKLLWPARDPIGQCIRIEADTAPCTTVVGVAEDLHMRSLKGQHEYTYYVPIAQYRDAAGTLLVRVSGDAADYVEPVRRQLQRVMPGAAYVTAEPFQNMVDPTMQSWRFGATMFVAFGALALALAGIGLYSMIAYGVAQRRQEIGIRIALGASRANVVRLVVRGGLRLVIVGVIAGGAISLWTGKWLATLLFRESPSDPAVYGGVAAVLIGVSLVATAMPAIAASRLDPNVALRAD
jgi:putative ABC transport system permease protein